MSSFAKVHAKILDSRGNTTVERGCGPSDGSFGRASPPEGLAGGHEAGASRCGFRVFLGQSRFATAVTRHQLRSSPTADGRAAVDQMA